MIRQPIISVMGHVDHGKTTLLDKIRSTAVASREAGGITQHIGASEVPIQTIEKICGAMLKAQNYNIVIPGLLFIDTPGHEAFTNLRRRGGSVADLAILVVDLKDGFAPQTIEAINILKEYKTPFIVAANKVDLITGWIPAKTSSILESIKVQKSDVANELQTKIYELIGSLSNLGFSSEYFERINNFKEEIAIVPLSAKTGEGLAELLMLVTGLSQRFLEARLKIEVKGKGKGSILERGETKGLGMTIDIILYDGTLKVNDQIAFATIEGVAKAKIKALIKPKPLSEIRYSGKFIYVDEVSAACGVKISANGLEDAIPGSPLVEVIGEDFEKEITTELAGIFKIEKEGVVLKADSIGGLDAVSKILESKGMKISKKGIGSVTKRDVIDAFSMNSVDPGSAVVLALNVTTEQEAQDASIESNIKIISSDIIYKLVDDYLIFAEEKRKNNLDQIEERIPFPAMMKVLPNTCFRVSHPAIFGVSISKGRIKPGYTIMNAIGEPIGRVEGIQKERSPVNIAKKGEEVAISVNGPSFGRQVREGQVLYTRPNDEEERMLFGSYSSLIDEEELELLKEISKIKRIKR